MKFSNTPRRAASAKNPESAPQAASYQSGHVPGEHVEHTPESDRQRPVQDLSAGNPERAHKHLAATL